MLIFPLINSSNLSGINSQISFKLLYKNLHTKFFCSRIQQIKLEYLISLNYTADHNVRIVLVFPHIRMKFLHFGSKSGFELGSRAIKFNSEDGVSGSSGGGGGGERLVGDFSASAV